MTEILQNLPQIRGEYKINEPLKKYTWLNVGGNADVMFFPKDEEDLQSFLKQNAFHLPIFVLVAVQIFWFVMEEYPELWSNLARRILPVGS